MEIPFDACGIFCGLRPGRLGRVYFSFAGSFLSANPRSTVRGRQLTPSTNLGVAGGDLRGRSESGRGTPSSGGVQCRSILGGGCGGITDSSVRLTGAADRPPKCLLRRFGGLVLDICHPEHMRNRARVSSKATDLYYYTQIWYC